MKRTIILLLALVAAITSGFAVFHQLTNQMELMPADTDTETSEESIAKMLDSSEATQVAEIDTGAPSFASEGEDVTAPTTLRDDGVIVVSSTSSSTSPEKKPGTVYAAYAQGVIGNGETSVLFFYAPWCPECQAADKILKALYKNGSPIISTYRVDYDSEKELKKTYGIVRQTSFVLIDETGKAVKTILSPSAADLTNFVQ